MSSNFSQPVITWIVIADNRQSTFLQTEQDDFSDVHPVLEIPYPDHPQHPDTHTIETLAEPLGDSRDLSLSLHYSRLIVDELEQANLDQEFHRLILIATAQLLELINNCMSSELSRQVDQRLDIEMMKEPLHIISARLQTGVYRKDPFEN